MGFFCLCGLMSNNLDEMKMSLEEGGFLTVLKIR